MDSGERPVLASLRFETWLLEEFDQRGQREEGF